MALKPTVRALFRVIRIGAFTPYAPRIELRDMGNRESIVKALWLMAR